MLEFFVIAILVIITAPFWLPVLVVLVVTVVACFALIVPSGTPKDSSESS